MGLVGGGIGEPCGREQEANLANETKNAWKGVSKNTLPGKVRSPLCLSGRERGQLEAQVWQALGRRTPDTAGGRAWEPRYDRWGSGTLGEGTQSPKAAGVGGGDYHPQRLLAGRGWTGCPGSGVTHTCLPSPAVAGGHHCHHRGFLPPGCPAPGCGSGPAGAEATGEEANRGHLPAQQ